MASGYDFRNTKIAILMILKENISKDVVWPEKVHISQKLKKELVRVGIEPGTFAILE